MAEYQNIATIPQPIAEAPTTTWTPTRTQTVEADVLVPLLQALVSAVVFTIAATALVWGMRWLDWWPFAGICFAISLALMWFVVFWNWRETLWRIEERYGVDLDHDKYKGKPPGAHPFLVGSNPQSPRQTEDAWHAMAEGFIHACFKSHKTGEKAHVGHRFNGEKLTPAMYDELRNILLAGRWARVKPGIRGGWEFMPDTTAAQIIAGLQRYREER